MDPFHSDKGWRYLRNRETVQADDMKPAGHGGYERVSRHEVGRTVIVGDTYLRARKRALFKSSAS